MQAIVSSPHRRKVPEIERHWRATKHAILAYHAGGWRKGESPLDALARAFDLPSDEMRAALTSHAAARDEFALLSSCLGSGWLDLSGLISIEDGVALAVALVNGKLARVPPEVRAFFGAPHKLEPSLWSRPLAKAAS